MRAMRALGWLCGLTQGLLLSGVAVAAPPVFAPTLLTRSLDNGLSLVVEEAHRSPRVAIHVAIACGAIDDPADRRGLARLAGAYLMREASTRHLARGARAELFRSLEVAPLEPDVRVELDRTTLSLRVPPAQLELALWLLSDLLAFAHERVDPAGLERQRDAVGAAHGRALGRFEGQRSVEALLYGAFHPQGGGALGGLAAVTAADVRAHLRERLGPERTSIAIVGDVDGARAAALVSQYFGPVVRGEDRPTTRPAPPAAASAAEGVLRANVGEAGVRVSWVTAPLHEPEDVALDVLYQHLAPRLDELLRKQGVPVSRAAVRERSSSVGSHFDVEVDLRSPSPTADVVRAVEAVIADAVRSIDDAGLTEARATMLRKTSFVAETAAGRAALYADSSAQRRDPLFVNRYLAAYGAVTKASLADVARSALVPTRRSVLTVLPDRGAPTGGRLELVGGAK